MTIRGRPVRFVAMTLGGWTIFRVMAVMPFGLPPAVKILRAAGTAAVAPLARATGADPAQGLPPPLAKRPQSDAPQRLSPRRLTVIATDQIAPPIEAPATLLTNTQQAFAPENRSFLAGFDPGAGLPLATPPPSDHSSRWSGALWLLVRGEDRLSGRAIGPRPGASQAGVRLDYGLAPDSPLRPAVYARLSSAIRGQAATEVAAGVAIRPRLPLPLILAVERRAGLSDGGRNAFALLAAGGVPSTDIGQGFRLDAYAQAGMVGLRSHDGFADGRVTIERPLALLPAIALGGALWGSTQPGVSRLDIGPQASVRLRVARQRMRLGVEWRQRIAGNATPASGPALTLGADF